MLVVLVQTSQPEAPARCLQLPSHNLLTPVSTPSLLLSRLLPLYETISPTHSFCSTPANCLRLGAALGRQRMASGRPWAWGWGGVTACSPTARHQGSAGATLVSDPRVQPSRTHRRPSSRTGLDRRSPLGPDKKEFCFLSIFLQLSPCEGCSRRCLGQVVEFSCCPVTRLEAENDPCHLAPC